MTITEQAMLIAEETGIRFCGEADWSSVGHGIMLWFVDPLTGSSFPVRADSLSAVTIRIIMKDMRAKEWKATIALRELGYSDDEIAVMKPDHVLALVKAKKHAPVINHASE